MPDVVQAQVMENQDIPVMPLENRIQMTGDIVVHLRGEGWGGRHWILGTGAVTP